MQAVGKARIGDKAWFVHKVQFVGKQAQRVLCVAVPTTNADGGRGGSVPGRNRFTTHHRSLLFRCWPAHWRGVCIKTGKDFDQ